MAAVRRCCVSRHRRASPPTGALALELLCLCVAVAAVVQRTSGVYTEKDPGAVVNIGRSGANSFQPPADIAGCDGVVAGCGDTPCDFVVVSKFAFGIPSTAVIDSVTVSALITSDNDFSTDDEVYIVPDVSAPGSRSANMAFNSQIPGGQWTTIRWSFTVAAWGIPSGLTPANVNSLGFGAVIGIDGWANQTRSPDLDCVRVGINYTLPVGSLESRSGTAPGSSSIWARAATATATAPAPPTATATAPSAIATVDTVARSATAVVGQSTAGAATTSPPPTAPPGLTAAVSSAFGSSTQQSATATAEATVAPAAATVAATQQPSGQATTSSPGGGGLGVVLVLIVLGAVVLAICVALVVVLGFVLRRRRQQQGGGAETAAQKPDTAAEMGTSRTVIYASVGLAQHEHSSSAASDDDDEPVYAVLSSFT